MRGAALGLMSRLARANARFAAASAARPRGERAPSRASSRAADPRRASRGGGGPSTRSAHDTGWHAPPRARPLATSAASSPGPLDEAAPAAAPSPAASPSPAPPSSVYSDPRAYELAFGFRDFDAEARFLRDVSASLGRGGGVSGGAPGGIGALLELGAGPAWHSAAVARLCPDARCVAVDNSPAMLRRAIARVETEGVRERVAVVDADFTDLDPDALRRALASLDNARKEANSDSDAALPGFDLACVLLGTAAHLTTTASAASLFKACASALNPGGLLVLELEHPFDLFDGSLMDAKGDAWDREVDGVKVLVEWGREGDYFDVETHAVARTVGVNVVDPATLEPAPGWAPIEETVTCRVFTHPEIAMLGEMAGLEVVATYGDMDQSVGLNDDDAHNMVVALKKI